MPARIVALLALALLIPQQAWGQTSEPTEISDLIACADKINDSERLACYDAAAKRLRESSAAKSFVALDREGVRHVEHESFGFKAPSIAKLFRFGEQPAAQRFEIQQVIERPDGLAAFVMTDGQVWALAESQYAGRVRAGAQATIKPGTFGSFLMDVHGIGGSFRVRREE